MRLYTYRMLSPIPRKHAKAIAKEVIERMTSVLDRGVDDRSLIHDPDFIDKYIGRVLDDIGSYIFADVEHYVKVSLKKLLETD